MIGMFVTSISIKSVEVWPYRQIAYMSYDPLNNQHPQNILHKSLASNGVDGCDL